MAETQKVMEPNSETHNKELRLLKGKVASLQQQLRKVRREKKKLQHQLQKERKSKRRTTSRLQMQLKDVKAKLKAEQGKAIHDALRDLPTETADFIRLQISRSEGAKRAQCTPAIKRLGVQVYHHSQSAYRSLRRKFLLPSPSTLQRFVNANVGNFQPGFLESVLQQMGQIAKKMRPSERAVSLVFDEMAIKKHLDFNKARDSIDGLTTKGEVANQAMVLMARGVASTWKQAIAYFLAKNTLSAQDTATVLSLAVKKLGEYGFYIVSVVCDQAPSNIRALKLLGATLEATDTRDEAHCITVDGKTIPVIFDVPHLIKSVRNNLKKHGLTIGPKKIEWGHFDSFYRLDKVNAVRMAPKITEKHVTLPPFMSMRVRLATQVFSHTVAAGMKTMVELHKLPIAAKDTAQFFEDMNTLFDTLNSRSIADANPWRRPLSPKSWRQLTLLTESLQWISSWTFRPRFIPPCQRGLLLTIRSVLRIVGRLGKEPDGFRFLCTAKLNQDCLENLFSVIRGKGGHRYHPTSREFSAALKSASITVLSNTPGANCIGDSGSPLLTAQGSQRTPTLPVIPSECVTEAALPQESFEEETIHEVLGYIGGWLVRQAAEEPVISSCKLCEKALVHVPASEHNYSTQIGSSKFLKHKRYSDSAQLAQPSSMLNSAIWQLEDKLTPSIKTHWADIGLTAILEREVHRSGILDHLVHPEHADTVSKIICKKYVMCRVGAELKSRNRAIQEDGVKRKRKLACLNTAP